MTVTSNQEHASTDGSTGDTNTEGLALASVAANGSVGTSGVSSADISVR